MELIIRPVTFPEVIEFNFEELKAEITAKCADYAELAYTEDQIKEAKRDRANLNKFSKALNDERKKIKNECLRPYAVFEAKVTELDSIVKKAVANVDDQVKGFEEAKKAEKLEAIKAFFDETDHPDWLTIDDISDAKWLNATTSLSAVKGIIMAQIAKVNDDMNVLGELPEFSFEAKDTYKKTLDLGMAIQEGKRLADIQRRKEEDARIREEQKALAEQMKTQEEPEPEKIPYEKPEVLDTPPERTICVTFQVIAKESQFDALNAAISQLRANSESIVIINKEVM